MLSPNPRSFYRSAIHERTCGVSECYRHIYLSYLVTNHDGIPNNVEVLPLPLNLKLFSQGTSVDNDSVFRNVCTSNQ